MATETVARPVLTHEHPEVVADRATRVVTVAGRAVPDLTYLEFELLAHLLEHTGLVLTRTQLMWAVWGYDVPGGGRTVDVHVSRLRRKLGEPVRSSLVTIRRVGYVYRG
ncbi:transcriptional regulator [Motilibacter rhizosphaerae]|uniref:Transcriptional regulator n=1 Tax=Motilibacter rhizosphaerae TaxID=598652 RepID=A0A4V2F4R7_9ACTN|nr:winged helix-turn-helix domain-containing protein [Motilibacter rhizosphaerae]RZS90259.1 transcriptional regulator [Motilibacter rhizosphaerae]